MRVVYVCPFSRDQISGGIKKAYQHVEILREHGMLAEVWQPFGKPDFIDTKIEPLIDASFRPRADDLLFFPETLVPPLRPLLARTVPGRKILFCSNQYYVFHDMPAEKTHFDIGFDFVVCSSHAIRNFLGRVFKYHDLDIIPPFVDRNLFRPRSKKLQIAVFPRKLPRHASLIQSTFHRKYPHMRHLPWVSIDNSSERIAADVLGDSAIMLALSYQESFGLTPIEAMAAGCLVAGYHGYGGLEYATAENGLWFWSDQIEEVADALHQMVLLYEAGGEDYKQRIESGSATAAQYDRIRTAESLISYIYKVRPQRPMF